MMDVDIENLKKEVIEIYKLYLKDPENKKAKGKAKEIYSEFSGSTIFFGISLLLQ